MNILVVYYSRTGKTENLAEYIGENIGAEIGEIQDTKDRRGLIGWFKSLWDAIKEEETEIKFDTDISGFDLVIVGTPVWAGNVSPAVRTFLNDRVNNHDIAFFATYGSSSGNVFQTMKNLSKEPQAVLGLGRKELGNEEKIVKEVDRFCKELGN